MRPEIIEQDADFYASKRGSPAWRHRRLLMSAFMLASDLLCLSLSMLTTIVLWAQVRTDFLFNVYLSLILPVALCYIAVYAVLGLYPGTGVSPVEELRRLTIGSFFILLGLVALSFFLRSSISWSRAILLISWTLISMSTPLARKLFRRAAVRTGSWGMPVVIIGSARGVEKLYRELRERPLVGLIPVLGVATPSVPALFPSSLAERADLEDIRRLFQGVDILMLALGRESFATVKSVLSDRSHTFRRVILMFDEERIGSVWFTPLHLVEYLGLEVSHNLLSPSQQFFKRLMDISLIIVFSPFLLAMFLLIGIAIKLDSRGPVFYSQKRVGHGEREIKIWKFRSMVLDAERVLQDHLDQDPALREEWDRNFKLKHDPRVTRVGRILRHTSLDELPNLWNVLRGEMSLVGPRPIVRAEIPLYGPDFDIYKQILPGMTGVWQVSGRSDVSYSERVNLDVYYVQNWSIWLDLDILLHTVVVAVQGRGAY